MSLAALPKSQIVLPTGLTAWDGIHAGIILAGAIVLAQVVRRLAVRMFGGNLERTVARVTGRFLSYVVYAAGFVYMLQALHVQIGPLVGALGIGGIALAFALQDTLQNLVAGILLQARRPIRRGDQVQIGSHQGVVQDIDLRNVLIRTADGLDVYVPNKTVLENPIINYTITPNRRLNVPIGVAYGSNLELVRTRLLEAVRRVPGVLNQPPPAVWVTGFGQSSIEVSVQCWFKVVRTNVWQVQSDAAIAIKAALDDAGIEIPYPQRTVSFDSLAHAPSSGDGAANGDRAVHENAVHAS